MLVRADWVVPVAAPPVRDGAVALRGNLICAVGPFDRLAEEYPAEPVTHHPGCVLMPGLVNAHTHLALTALHEVVPSAPFPEWLALVVRAMRALGPDDLAASTVLGAHRAMASGTTVVGEIAYGPESPAIAADTGLGGAFFWEVLGLAPEELPDRLAELEYPADPARIQGRRQRYGLSPHAPYTSGPDLLREVRRRTRAEGTGLALHVAESPAETELLRAGTGPLAEVAARSAHGFAAPGTTPVRYLSDLGVLDGALAVHCAELLPVDIPVLASRAAAVVLCPRSNAYLHVGPAPVKRLAASGVTLALGTDSLASNADLDLFAEARALTRVAPSLSAERLIRMMTAEGARALGLESSFGTLEPGRQADLAVYRVDGGEDPYAALLERAGRSTVEAVMAAGLWRVLGGQATFPSRFAETAARHAALRATLAIQ